MSGNVAAPNAWDDEDWETLADKQDVFDKRAEDDGTKKMLSKAERKAQHAAANKQLWQSAESPQKPIFLQAKGELPLASEFRPAMKVLSRKPPAAASAGAASRAADDEDSEEEERRKAAASFAERQARAQKEREEKQRKYQEARERIFNSPAAASDEAQSRPASRPAQPGGSSRNSSRGKGRGRGGPAEAQGSSADQSPARSQVPQQQQQQQRQLFDPNYTAKPSSAYAQRNAGGSRPSTPGDTQHVRSPKGPDASGRGGFGFTGRGKPAGP